MAQANSPLISASRALVSHVDVMRDVLDGFPVKPLIDHYLGAIARNPADAKRDAALLDGTLTSWINNLSITICDYANFADDETLCRLSEQLKSAQEALLVLRKKLTGIEQLRADALKSHVSSRRLSQRPRKSPQHSADSLSGSSHRRIRVHRARKQPIEG